MTAPDIRRMDLEGELTIVAAAEHHQRLRSFLASGTDLQLSLSGVTELDTAGLQLLLLARGEADRRGARLTFHELHQAVRDVLAIVHLEAEFDDDARPGGGIEA